jgi:hypothetical protein
VPLQHLAAATCIVDVAAAGLQLMCDAAVARVMLLLHVM